MVDVSRPLMCVSAALQETATGNLATAGGRDNSHSWRLFAAVSESARGCSWGAELVEPGCGRVSRQRELSTVLKTFRMPAHVCFVCCV